MYNILRTVVERDTFILSLGIDVLYMFVLRSLHHEDKYFEKV